MSNRLSDILANGNRDSLAHAWDTTKAAGDFAPLPAGEYIAHVLSGELFTSRQNATPGYKIAFKVIEGEHVGRQFWHDVWLTPAALPMAKRDLGKLGVTAFDQLDQPLPQGIRVKAKVTLRHDDAGAEDNRVRSFDVLGIDPPDNDPFAPAAPAAPAAPTAPTPPGAGGAGASAATATPGDADETGLPVSAARPDDGIPI